MGGGNYFNCYLDVFVAVTIPILQVATSLPTYNERGRTDSLSTHQHGVRQEAETRGGITVWFYQFKVERRSLISRQQS